ncbi:uncharacterized protein [Panulirus ornatus]|uniref:uncharacterized protein n=1 Tax=Panulirus ornatus TaxID=150431 RepID=UPI003A846A81
MMRLVTSRFDLENGPLWRARLMPCGPADPYPVPHIKNQFPHQYILIFSFCHSTADGMITLMVFSLIMKFLQDFMKGVPIDDGQLGKIVSHSHSEQIEKMLMEDLKKDPERFDTLQRDLADKQFKSLLDEAFGVPEVTHPTVESIHTVMDKSTVDKFMRKCRNVGITFNSGFTCVINTALVELVQEAGVVRDMYRVTSRHVIDERRYWGGDPFKDFGCHVGAMSHSMVTPHNIRQNFWEYAKVFGKEFREKLRGNYHFFERILKARSLPKDFTYDSYYATPPPLLYDYLISYMYNSNFSRIELYDHLHLTDFRSYVLIHNCEYSNQHTILTLHDTFYEFTYSTGRMTQETAQKFHDKVLTVLNDLANI